MKITLLFFLCITGIVSAQDYSKRYEHNSEPVIATAISSSDDLRTVIAGKYGYSGASLVCQLDTSGSIQWQKWIDWQQEGLQNTLINEILPTTDSSYLFSAHSQLPGTPERYQSVVFKMDFDGNMLWIKRFESDDSSCFRPSIAIQNDSTYWLSWGGLWSGTMNNIVKLDENGNLLDSFAFEHGEAPYVASLEVLNDTTLLMAGQLNSSPAKTYMNAISTDGQLQWSYTYDSLLIEDAIVTDNEIYMVAIDPFSQASLFVKADSAGNILSSKKIGNSSGNLQDARGRIVQLQDGTFMTVSQIDEWNPVFVQVDAAGDFISGFNMEGKNGAVMPNANGGATFVSNGPLYGVKNMYDEHFGIVRLDSLLEERECLYSSFPTNLSLSVPNADAFNVALAVAPAEIAGSFNIPVNDATITQTDGCVLFIGSVSEFEKLSFVQVYPNVSGGIFHFDISLSESVDILIYSSDGRLIANRENLFGSATVDLSEFADGSYYFKAISESGHTNGGTLVLMK